MSKRTKLPFICAPCRRRLFSSSGSNRSLPAKYVTLPAPPPTSGSANLTSSRRLILLHGVDAPKFLNGATTNKIPSLSHREGFFSAFLTAQGRVLFDIFIYPAHHSSSFTKSGLLAQTANTSDPTYIIECDASGAQTLVSHIKKYKLRSKFKHRLIMEDEWNVWSAWGIAQQAADIDIGCSGGRAPGMGQRIVLPASQSVQSEDVQNQDLDMAARHIQYTIHRYQLGVAEGQSEITYSSSLPQESNLDYMGGIDYRKGCYVGQELTIRTHHTGVVRKRILPIQLFPYTSTSTSAGEAPVYDPSVIVPAPPAQANIKKVDQKGRSAGKICGSVGNVGLALCRLEMMTSTILPGGVGSYNPEDQWKAEWEDGEDMAQVKMKAFVPEWHKLHSVNNERS